MPAAMSFLLTQEQIRNRTKTVTRRLGWKRLAAGDVLWAVEKVQGLAKGEKQQRLAKIRITSVRREPLSAIDQADVIAEGFPRMSPAEFIEMFCRAMRCDRDVEVARIEFEYVDDDQPALF